MWRGVMYYDMMWIYFTCSGVISCPVIFFHVLYCVCWDSCSGSAFYMTSSDGTQCVMIDGNLICNGRYVIDFSIVVLFADPATTVLAAAHWISYLSFPLTLSSSLSLPLPINVFLITLSSLSFQGCFSFEAVLCRSTCSVSRGGTTGPPQPTSSTTPVKTRYALAWHLIYL